MSFVPKKFVLKKFTRLYCDTLHYTPRVNTPHHTYNLRGSLLTFFDLHGTKIFSSFKSVSEFTSIINHETFLTQIIQYDHDKTIYHVPKHAQLSEARITIFHNLNLQATRLEKFCVLQKNFEKTKKITEHSASMMDYQKEKSEVI